MPYRITPQCTGKDTICEDICPYDCVEPVGAAGATQGKRALQIDEQFCVDCGMCAIACPDQAIVYNGAFSPMHLTALGQAAWLRPQVKHSRAPIGG